MFGRILLATAVLGWAAAPASAQSAPAAAQLFPWQAAAESAGPGYGRVSLLASDPTTFESREEPPGRLFESQQPEIKFKLSDLMETLRDSRHEGWVTAAYPDPKTGRPLIGAGFSLDLPARQHPQLDPLNPHPFLEPSSAELWQAAGLAPQRLEEILDQFDRNSRLWSRRTYQQMILRHSLAPQITDGEAMNLLRISALQAVYNARAYCRRFDALSGPQQMAVSELVFQMGVNLEEFVQFLDVINADGPSGEGAEHWRDVQRSLMESQWAKRYRDRASTVIAMFDPGYPDNPVAAERRVQATLRPAVLHRNRRRSRGRMRRVAYSRNSARARQSRGRHSRHGRRRRGLA